MSYNLQVKRTYFIRGILVVFSIQLWFVCSRSALRKGIQLVFSCDVTLCDFQREDGCQLLLDLLDWKSFTQSDLAQSICLDCIYDSVMFCVNKGFTWMEVSCIITLVCEMLHAAECKYT